MNFWYRLKKITLPTPVLILLGISGSFFLFAWLNFNLHENVNSVAETTVRDIDWHQAVNATILKSLNGKDILKYFLWANHSSCLLVHDFGGKMKKNPSGLDGQKSVCLDPTVAPRPPRCLIYSFGINNEWSFDEVMEQYGCKIFSFDPSMNLEDHDHAPNIHFFNLALDSRDIGNKNRTLATIYNKVLKAWHGEQTIDYLKMDVEFAEWHILTQIVESGMMDKVRQLAVEFHFSPDDSIELLRERVGILKLLEEYGLVRFNSRYNPWFYGPCFQQDDKLVSCGFEIAWYNSKLRRRWNPDRNAIDWTLHQWKAPPT